MDQDTKTKNPYSDLTEISGFDDINLAINKISKSIEISGEEKIKCESSIAISIIIYTLTMILIFYFKNILLSSIALPILIGIPMYLSIKIKTLSSIIIEHKAYNNILLKLHEIRISNIILSN